MSPQEHRELAREKELAERDRRWRQEDKRSNGIQLLAAALLGFLGAMATLIAADKLPWWQ